MARHTVYCENCGEMASVRAYGRVEFNWPTVGQQASKPKIKAIHLTIDCPSCGVIGQIQRLDAEARVLAH